MSLIIRMSLLICALAVSACGTRINDEPFVLIAAKLGPDRTYSIPGPAVQSEVLAALKLISLDISSVKDGEVKTSPVVYQGRKSGLFLWRGAWEERATIEIYLFRSYAGDRTLLFLTATAEERPNQNYPWKRVSESERATALRQLFLQTLDRRITPK